MVTQNGLKVAPVSRVNAKRECFLRLAMLEVDNLKLRNPAHLTETQHALIAACNDFLFEQAERERFRNG